MTVKYELIKFQCVDDEYFVPIKWVIGFSIQGNDFILIGEHNKTYLHGTLQKEEVKSLLQEVSDAVWIDGCPFDSKTAEYIHFILFHEMESEMSAYYVNSEAFGDRIEEHNWRYKQMDAPAFIEKSKTFKEAYEVIQKLKI